MNILLSIAVIAAIVIVLHSPIQGMMSSPWAPFWFSHAAATGGGTIGGEALVALPDVDPGSLTGHGSVSDVQRYQLARFAGWTPLEAIIATAISIAEDGSGDPAALSPPNRDGSRDLGLWQINSSHWPSYGGSAALVDPLNNARAAYAIYRSQGWCAWSTFNQVPSCGPGHSSAYLAFLGRAQTAANATPPPTQG